LYTNPIVFNKWLCAAAAVIKQLKTGKLPVLSKEVLNLFKASFYFYLMKVQIGTAKVVLVAG